jgi:hypothetical protein
MPRSDPEMSQIQPIEDVVRTAFAAARETPAAPFEEDRFLAFLTSPPAPSGRRVRDTFAGRRRFVRFVERVQLEAGACLANDEWERGPSLAEFVALIAKKSGNVEATRRLVQRRLDGARRRLWFAPIVIGTLCSPLLGIAWRFPSVPVRLVAGTIWLMIFGGLLAFGLRDIAYHRALLRRVER